MVADKEFLKNLFDISKNYYIAQAKANEQVTQVSKSCVGDMFYTHKIAVGLLEYLFELYRNKPGLTNESISGRLSLIASFYLGIDKCEDCIMEGYYIQAATLLRQEYEALCAISEHKNGKRVQKKTPSVKAIGITNCGPVYGDLSGLAHLACDDVLASLTIDSEHATKENHPVSPVPCFNDNLCKQMFGLHILLISEVSWELVQLYREMYGYDPNDQVINGREFILGVLQTEKIISNNASK